jgi:hypothetical protein
MNKQNDITMNRDSIESVQFDLSSKAIIDWFSIPSVKNFLLIAVSGILGSTVAAFRSFYSY